jgi:hypothetical protein
MAGKISFKTAISLFISCGIVIILSACLEPVDFNAFISDPKISGEDGKGIIDRTKPKVIIHGESENYKDLTAGDRNITGLASGKYYRLEEYDKGMVFKRNLFIKADGDIYGDLSQIGKLIGDQVKNLNNDFTYKVMSVKVFNGETAHKYFVWGATTPDYADLSTGEVTITVPAGDYFLDLAALINVNKDYEVMKFPISISGGGTNAAWDDSKTSARLKNDYSGAAFTSFPDAVTYYALPDKPGKTLIGIFQYSGFTGKPLLINNTSLIRLESVNTQSEYVFAEYDNSGKITNFNLLNVKINVSLVNQTPTAGDFNIGNLTQTYGNVTAVTISPKPNKSGGAITVKYDGSTTLPSAVGTYAVTFDVAAAPGWNAAADLSADTLTINKATPVAADFEIGNLAQVVDSVTAVTISPKSNKSGGAITVKYNGSTTLPSAVGTYPVTFDVAETTNWNAAANLPAGDLVISASKVNVTFSVVDVKWSGVAPPVFTGKADYSQSANKITITITVTNDNAYTGHYYWYIDFDNGDEFTGTGTGTKTITIVDNKGVDDAVNWYQVGTYTITLRVKNKTTNAEEAGQVTFICN